MEKLDFETYTKTISFINSELEKIAALTAGQAKLGVAEPGNPNFDALMSNQQRLVDLSEKITNKMMQQFEQSKGE
ncbi:MULTISPECIES: hypothetical protein [Photobacterium]|uniref:Uncharacterized protein n=1 Tax=Photobacterium leiognathi subsp. mandapamensis TaxID=48408 RepID=A0A2T3KSB8_PHOLD|nr:MULTISPECIES: hypothetical protein [Photobacterium]NVO75333.1 hypothetical protein [Photobacterium damselae subsp. damselae]PSV09342.1 hypothetical protein C0W93_15180 [Photobacterium leiognathi subsp. mandapamensis]SPY25003.1 Uncharacterised protein [Photobacterium damselae]